MDTFEDLSNPITGGGWGLRFQGLKSHTKSTLIRLCHSGSKGTVLVSGATTAARGIILEVKPEQ